MIEIIPAIMPKDLQDLEDKASLVYKNVKTIQLDLMDGEYVEAKTWPYFLKNVEDLDGIMNGKVLPFADNVDYELDLMVMSPERDLKKFVAMRPKRIIFHARSIEDHTDFIETINSFPNLREEIEVGVAIGPEENLDFADELIRNTDFVQIMGIKNIGNQGEGFDANVFEQIKNLKMKYPNVILSIDGGVNLENANFLREAEVDRLVSGSTIFKSENKEEVINTLRNG